MLKQISIIFFLFLITSSSSKAQSTNTDFATLANALIKKESEHLPVLKTALLVDSFSISETNLSLYFNTHETYSKGSLTGDYVEMLPEILIHLTSLYSSTAQLSLLAKDAITNKWKTLDYFSNQTTTPKYIPILNNDPFPNKVGKNNPVSSRVFPTYGSPTAVGALAGKTVWLSPGHGWLNSGSGFTTQRGNTNDIVEDLVSAENIDYYLMGYLYNAGSNVWSVRERDVNTNEIIVDNDIPSSGYSETGSWNNGSVVGYGGTYRVASADATESATASFVPNITQSGLYWVSVRCVAGANRATDVSFKIIHTGDTSIIKVNQEIHGETWVHLGQFYFTNGSLNKITITNLSLETGQAIIADAVRLGGGIGSTPDCNFPSQPASNRPKFEESAKQYAGFQGYPTCDGDVTIRPKYSEYELQKGTAVETANSVFVSLHSNAFNATAVGTETYSYNGMGTGMPNITAGSINLRNYIHTQVVADIRALWKPTWVDRGVKTANFGELRELTNMPGTLVELAFHDAAADANEMKQPEFRRIAARAIYKGIVKFFNNRDGSPLIFLPEEPTGVIAKNIGSNNIQISWAAPITGGAYGDAAAAYKVYISTNGKSFKDGITTSGSTYTFSGNAQTIYYFKIAATNAGGESFTSSVVAAKTPIAGSTNVPYLIVDAFDRLDRGALIPRTESAALGTVRRMFLERMNRYDYMIEHAQALGNCNTNIAFDGCQNEAVTNGTVLLSTYSALDWFTGEESTVDRSVSPAEALLLKAYLNAGGNLLISGSEIGWDIGRDASANLDADFYNNYLKAVYVNDDANTYDFAGTSILFDSQSGTFDNSTNGYYDVDFPDRITTFGGSTIALNYTGGTADGAAVGFKGTFNVLYMAFPFEAITSATIRNNLMCNAVAYLTPTLLPIIGLTISGKNNGSVNVIKFATIAEINTKYFLTERSENGIIFSPVSQIILPKGNITSGAEYDFTDKNILPTGYYRIKVIDDNGSVSYSEIIFIKAQKNDKLFTVINNPAIINLKIALNNYKGTQITLSNSIGQLIYKSNKIDASIFSIDVSKFAKGIYYLTVTANNKYQAEKIIIQ